MPRKPELSAGLMDPRGPNADFTFFYHFAFRLFIPFRTWRLIMKMAVHYFLSSDFCFPFPIESKFKFIDFALNLLRKKEKSFPMRYVSS